MVLVYFRHLFYGLLVYLGLVNVGPILFLMRLLHLVSLRGPD